MTATTVAASRPQSNKQSLWRRFVKGRGLSYCVLAVIGVFWIFPFLWMALGSLKTQREILAKPPKLLPEHASLANFAKWFGELNFGTYFTNSMVVAVITVLGNMVLCSMVGYALAKMDFAGKNILFGAVMVTLMVPSVATFVPLFGIVTQRLTDDLWSTTSHELDPPMAIRSTGICPIHLVLNKRNRSFSRISMTAIAVPMAVAHGNGRPSCSSRRKMASESDGVGFIVPMRMNSAEYAMTSPMNVGISCSHSICARMSVFLAPTCRSPAISRFFRRGILA